MPAAARVGRIRGINMASQSDVSCLTALSGTNSTELETLRHEVAELREREARFRGMFTNAVEGFFQTTPDGQYLAANPALARIYGYESPEELTGNLTDIGRMLYVDPARRGQFRDLMHQYGVVENFESEIYQKTGETIWISENARKVSDDRGELMYYEGTVVDVTQKRMAQQALARSEQVFRSLAETAGTSIYILRDGELAYANPAFERLSCMPLSELVDMDMLELVHPDDRELYSQRLTELLSDEGKGRSVDFRLCDRGGACHWLEETASVIDHDGNAAVLGIAVDVTTRKAAEDKLAHQAFHDALTGLPNRVLFMERLDTALRRCRRHTGDNYSVLFVDLDRFKLINDSLGHHVGDLLLKGIGRRLARALRACDTVARFGGDEFVVLLEGLGQAREANTVIGRIQAELARPFDLDGNEVFVTASIGVVLGGEDYSCADDVIRDSDIAMYRAKNQGRACYEVFDSGMHRQAVKLLQMESDLRRALDRHEFRVYYQPIMSLSQGRLSSLEALVRWEHPAKGLVLPSEFIPMAEETGLIVPIGELVMSEACRQMAIWQNTVPGLAGLPIAVNLSARQLQHDDLVEQVRDILSDTGLDPQCLRLEITESVVMADAGRALGILERLRSLGVRVAVDDFGTGYSSLSYLHQLPIDTLKVDKSFVARMGKDKSEIVRTVINLARTLNLEVVAEGVETVMQADELATLECHHAQGFHYAKPMAPADLAMQFGKLCDDS